VRETGQILPCGPIQNPRILQPKSETIQLHYVRTDANGEVIFAAPVLQNESAVLRVENTLKAMRYGASTLTQVVRLCAAAASGRNWQWIGWPMIAQLNRAMWSPWLKRFWRRQRFQRLLKSWWRVIVSSVNDLSGHDEQQCAWMKWG
jgi:hypothetical protein